MAGRFAKHNGAVALEEPRNAWKPKSGEMWRYKPDVYQPFRKPIRSPNLLTNRVEREFGKRIVEQAERQVARRAPLALAGPLGDLLALGLITWDLYQLLLELQNQRNPVPPVADPVGGTGNPLNYDWAGWNIATGQTNALPEIPDNFPPFDYGTDHYEPVGNPYVVGTPVWQDQQDGFGFVPHQESSGQTLEAWLAANPQAGRAFQYKHDYNVDTAGGTVEGVAFDGWYQRTAGAADPLYVGVGVPLPSDLPLDWAEPDPNMKRNFFPDGVTDAMERTRNPEDDPNFKRGRRLSPPRPSRPAPRTRERKMKGSLNMILKALDIVSEASEWVGAIYDALPEDVRKKWDQKGRGLIDNAGQYGIDGADWKLNAIWHNWHKVDVEQAIKNIIANEFQDKILGAYQRALPKNIGHVADAGSLGLNDLINLFNDTIGLS